jgi:hypothetical protein
VFRADLFEKALGLRNANPIKHETEPQLENELVQA